MTAATDPARPDAPAQLRTERTKWLIGAVATLLALWLGLTAPAVSPVAPATSTSTSTQQVSSTAGGQELDLPAPDDGVGGGGRR